VQTDEESLNQKIGRRAKAMRAAKGLTLKQVEFALSTIGVRLSYASVLRLESGDQAWSAAHVEHLAQVYGVDPAAFFVTVEEQGLLRAWRIGGVAGIVQWAAEKLAKSAE